MSRTLGPLLIILIVATTAVFSGCAAVNVPAKPVTSLAEADSIWLAKAKEDLRALRGLEMTQRW
jgi:hypothetical protein